MPNSEIETQSQVDAAEWLPQVVVKLADSITAPIGAGAEVGFAQLAALLGPAPVVGQLAVLLGNAPIRRVFDSFDPGTLASLVADAQAADSTYDPPNLNSFVEIDCDGIDADEAATLLGQVDGVVDRAYVRTERSDPAVVGTTNPLFARQQYIAPAPTGIGAKAAWAAGADGSGIGFIDVEQGWSLSHPDLPQTISLLKGVSFPSSYFHGTAVLGEVVGIDNSHGIVGIAPGADANVVSYRPAFPTFGRAISRSADAIVFAATRLQFGDVLLVEIHRGGLPLETDPDDFAAIRFATARGVIVVAAAGNGNENLDDYEDPLLGIHVLNRGLPAEFLDSGAIVVGACTSGLSAGLPRTRWLQTADFGSNFGSRIDCHGWGHMIVTTGEPDDLNSYTSDTTFYDPPGMFGFGGTSGAAPMIAGVCLLVQHLCSILTPLGAPTGRMGPFEMRDLLRRLANGTDLDLNVPALSFGEIGCMPNLAAIIANEFVEFT